VLSSQEGTVQVKERIEADRGSAQVERITTVLDTAAASPDDEISLLDIWRVLRRYKITILATVLLGVALPGIIGLVTTPVFRAETLVAPVTESDERSRLVAPLAELGGFAALAGVNIERGSRKNEAIALLRSRALTEQFIKDEKLRPVLFGQDWADDDPRWDAGEADGVPTLAAACELFDKEVRQVYEDRKSGLSVVAIEWEDPQLAAQWANELVRRVNAMMRERSTRESEQAIAYLQKQLGETSAVEMQRVLHRLVESEMKEIILANIKEEYAFRVIDPAVVPEKPFKPVLVPMLALGAVLGLMVGIMLALFRDFLRRQNAQNS
jgi:uncharacterized protein involved in exopolysaccharide biosynthesis